MLHLWCDVPTGYEADLLRAATASGGDLVEYFFEDDEAEDNGKLN
jgi:hypothetical protein